VCSGLFLLKLSILCLGFFFRALVSKSLNFFVMVMHIHTEKKAVFWDVAPCSSGVNRRFGGTYRLHLQGIRESIRKSAREASVCL
jgi:hypothetical protein